MQESTGSNQAQNALQPKRYRTIWISDTHLGSRGCKADYLSEFLKHHDCETLIMVGDIIDGWRMRKKVFWPQAHTNVIRRILTRAKRGTKVIYITGNHDDMLRRYSGIQFGNIDLVDEYIHITANGRKLWCIHGDQFDGVIQCHRWIAFFGDFLYETMLHVNRWFNQLRHRLGFGYWSLSAYLKGRVKRAVNFISQFEEAVAKEAEHKQMDGVICGHIHHAEIRRISEQVTYYNCGDWVESCTALVEDFNGNIEQICWVKLGHETAQAPVEKKNPSLVTIENRR
ncbi:UDP-2,3-diacylglucosamine diphosphatase [Thiomicrorhabdus sp. zzn3]|uniref:UDP-2,3-diacylglucosamine diphosphatase n=1 Tax=Thiomicrorhabdus sp. zzn3 TaxID=3039775 RepID=UPI0024367288|nr:UDP-2,3-diacylglucosamine diphosphatase [Thiomicrorhabdus sp. zzn3]MDG6778972.1 UDP-2,3-diacylglucosamine diphosphatase [Thiomicrorhabdus sp. zzn3]